MKTYTWVILVAHAISCAEDGIGLEEEKKDLEVTVTLSTGEIRGFSLSTVKGPSPVSMGCSSGSYITMDEAPVFGIDLSAINGINCVTGRGTYYYACEYYPKGKSGTSQPYRNWLSKNPGSITYSVFNGKYVEGYFEAVCKTSLTATDSARVKGKFKGYLK